VLVCSDTYESNLRKITELKKSIDDFKRETYFETRKKESTWIKEKRELILEKDQSKSKDDAALEKMSQDLTELSKKNKSEQKKIKSDHDLEIRNLENYYEDRLEEASKQIESVKSEFERRVYQHRIDMNTKDKDYRSKIEELSSIHSNIEYKLQTKISSLLEESSKTEKMRLEMLNQQEEEYERELLQHSLESHQRIRHKQLAIDDKNIKIRHLISKNEQLMRQIKELKSKISHQREVHTAEANCSQSSEEELRKMNELVKQRDHSLAESKALIHGMRVDQIALETKLYSMQKKVEELENVKLPLLETIKRQDAQGKGLLKKLGQTNDERPRNNQDERHYK